MLDTGIEESKNQMAESGSKVHGSSTLYAEI